MYTKYTLFDYFFLPKRGRRFALTTEQRAKQPAAMKSPLKLLPKIGAIMYEGMIVAPIIWIVALKPPAVPAYTGPISGREMGIAYTMGIKVLIEKPQMTMTIARRTGLPMCQPKDAMTAVRTESVVSMALLALNFAKILGPAIEPAIEPSI